VEIQHLPVFSSTGFRVWRGEIDGDLAKVFLRERNVKLFPCSSNQYVFWKAAYKMS
jgi:hypothetical protein